MNNKKKVFNPDYNPNGAEESEVKLAPNTNLNDTSLLAWAPL